MEKPYSRMERKREEAKRKKETRKLKRLAALKRLDSFVVFGFRYWRVVEFLIQWAIENLPFTG